MPRPTPRPQASEKDIEAALRDVLAYGGFHTVKTDAALVTRRTAERSSAFGTRGHGSIPSGFPDLIALHPLPGTTLCLAALVETKSALGTLRDSQLALHAELRDKYKLHPHVLRDPGDATLLIAEARRLRALLSKGPGHA